MNGRIIHQFLDKLDQALNSNSFWIELGVPEGEWDLEQTLLRHLKAGSFHYELLKQDVQRDWGLYYEQVTPRHQENPIVLPKPGNTWNGIERLNFEPINRADLVDHWKDLLTGTKKYYSRSSLGSPLETEKAQTLIEGLLDTLDKQTPNWQAYNIEPNFLNVVDDFYDSAYIKLAYFENSGRDVAFAFKVEDSLYILLCNGYS